MYYDPFEPGVLTANGRRVTSSNSGVDVDGRIHEGHRTSEPTYNAGYAATGDLVSRAKDSNPVSAGTTTWGTISWNATVPANTTLRFQAAANDSPYGPFNFVGPNGTSGTYFTNGASLSQFNGNRYLKYKAFFATTNSSATPTLADVHDLLHDASCVDGSGHQATGIMRRIGVRADFRVRATRRSFRQRE